MEDLHVKIINKSKNNLPQYETPFSAGLDLRADLEISIVLTPMQRKLIPTGLYIELPTGYEAQIRPRSGLAYKKGVSVLNSPGTIDADYRGEVGVLLINLSKQVVTIEPKERIAQMVVAKHEQVNWLETKEITETQRGAGGFGSTGNK